MRLEGEAKNGGSLALVRQMDYDEYGVGPKILAGSEDNESSEGD